MASKVTIDGLDDLIRAAKKKAEESTTNVEDALTKSALILTRSYIENVNNAGLVDTGRWIDSITFNKEDYGTNHPAVEVGSTVQEPPYPSYHELGTSKFPATPTLGPAYDENKDKIVELIKDAIKKGLK
jgi:HK97 gp10 family phage protein